MGFGVGVGDASGGEVGPGVSSRVDVGEASPPEPCSGVIVGVLVE